MNLLVTGGAGFIGSHFIRYMLATYPDVRVVNLDKLTYAGNLETLIDVQDDSRYEFVQGDICDAALVDELASRVDAMVNFAAETHGQCTTALWKPHFGTRHMSSSSSVRQ